MSVEGARVSRRAMLAGAAATGIVALGAMAATGGGVDRITKSMRALLKGRRRPASLATAEVEDWIAEAGTQFVAAGYRLRLAGVKTLRDAGRRPQGLRRKSFIAVFDVVDRRTLRGDRLYAIRHPRYPAFQIYLTNAPTRARPRRVHALFS